MIKNILHFYLDLCTTHFYTIYYNNNVVIKYATTIVIIIYNDIKYKLHNRFVVYYFK